VEVGRGRPRWRYRTRLLVGLLVVWVPITVLVVGILTGLAARALSRAQEELLAARADATATNVEQWVQERQDNVTRLAGVVGAQFDDLGAVEATLQRTARARDIFDVLFVVDSRGVVLASTDRGLTFDPSGEEWFGRALVGQTVISPLYREGDRVRWVVASPARRDGAIVGVALADLRVEVIGALVADLGTDTAEISLVGPDQLLIYSTSFGASSDGATLLGQGALDPRAPVGTAGSLAALDGRSGATRYRDRRGVDVFGGYAPVESLGWAIVAQEDVRIALADVRRQVILGVLSTLAGIVALAGAASLFAQRETRHLRALAEDSTATGDQVLGNVASLHAASEELAATTGQQSRAAMTTSASIEELSHTAAAIAGAVVRVAEQAAETRADLERAEADVQRSGVRTMALADRVGDIESVLGRMDELADQTGMLALNAAIEAARAGEAGRGFTVVADEVRRLSERSKDFAADIVRMVEETRQETSATLDAMNHGSKRLRESLTLLEDVTVVAQQVRTATTEQRTAAEQASAMMAQTSDASHQVAMTAGQIAAAAADLTALAADLARTAATLRERL
jgi:hypothetical protein